VGFSPFFQRGLVERVWNRQGWREVDSFTTVISAPRALSDSEDSLGRNADGDWNRGVILLITSRVTAHFPQVRFHLWTITNFLAKRGIAYRHHSVRNRFPSLFRPGDSYFDSTNKEKKFKAYVYIIIICLYYGTSLANNYSLWKYWFTTGKDSLDKTEKSLQWCKMFVSKSSYSNDAKHLFKFLKYF